MKTIILVSGYARSGKDTTCDILKDTVSSRKVVSVKAFADYMKDIICKTFDISREELDTYKNNTDSFSVDTVQHSYTGSWSEKHTNYREILQRFGTEAMKSVFGEDVWVKLIADYISKSDSDVIIISDWRFKKELWSLLDSINEDNKVVTIRVTRQGQVNTSTHISEVDLDTDIDFDYHVVNDGVTRSYLEEQLRDICIEEGI